MRLQVVNDMIRNTRIDLPVIPGVRYTSAEWLEYDGHHVVYRSQSNLMEAYFRVLMVPQLFPPGVRVPEGI